MIELKIPNSSWIVGRVSTTVCIFITFWLSKISRLTKWYNCVRNSFLFMCVFWIVLYNIYNQCLFIWYYLLQWRLMALLQRISNLIAVSLIWCYAFAFVLVSLFWDFIPITFLDVLPSHFISYYHSCDWLLCTYNYIL